MKHHRILTGSHTSRANGFHGVAGGFFQQLVSIHLIVLFGNFKSKSIISASLNLCNGAEIPAVILVAIQKVYPVGIENTLFLLAGKQCAAAQFGNSGIHGKGSFFGFQQQGDFLPVSVSSDRRLG